jgi:hypothetical protein
MSKAKDYATMVANAESAVISVKDPELRRVAFQKVLEDLLTVERGVDPKPPRAGRVSKPSAKTSKKANQSKSGTKAYIEELQIEGFFNKQQTIAAVKAELENRGHHIPLTSLSGPLQRLCQQRVLRRQRIKAGKNRETFGYSNW